MGGPAPGPHILVAGPGSFLARHTLPHFADGACLPVGHARLDEPAIPDGIGCIVSFMKHPLIAAAGYRPERDDPDVRLARAVGERAIRYVMLSTRKVYAAKDGPLREDDPPGPSDPYGRNKLAVEEALRAILGERLLVLRLANIFGFELEPGRRTFLGTLLASLEGSGRIVFDMSPFVARDFLPVERAGRLIARLADPALPAPAPVLNLGSGIPLPTGRLALWIIEGYGKGDLVVRSPEERDPFVLDVTRLGDATGERCTVGDLARACRAIGRRLAAPAGPP